MINRLSSTGLKGPGFTDALAPVTIWVGANSSGKTSRLDTVQLAARGRHPDPQIGGTNAGIMQLAAGKSLSVRMDYSHNGVTHQVQRDWTPSKTGYTCSNSEPCDDFAALLLNPRDYFSLSPAKQVEYVADLVTVTDPQFTVEGLTAAVKNIHLDTNTPASESAINAVCDRLRAVNASGPLPWLEAALADTKASLKSANASRKRMVGITTGLEQLRAQDTEAVTTTGTVERDLTQARAKLAVLQGDEGQLKARVAAAAAGRARREALEAVKTPEGVNEAALVADRDQLAAKIADLSESVRNRLVPTDELGRTLATCKAQRDAALESVTGLGQRIVRLEAVKAPVFDFEKNGAEVKRLGQLVADLSGSFNRRTKTVQQVADSVLRLQVDKAAAAAKYTECRSQIEQIQADIVKFMARDCCPICLANGGDWQARWKAEQEKRIAELQKKMDTVTIEGTRLKKELERVARIGADMRTEDEQLRVAQTELAAVDRQNEDALAAKCRYTDIQTELAHVKKEREQQQARADLAFIKIAELQPSYDAYVIVDRELDTLRLRHSNAVTLLASAAAALSKFKTAQAELAALPVPESERTLAHEQTQIGDKMAEWRVRISDLEAKAREIAALRGSLRSQMQAAQKATELEQEIAVLKATEELLRERQSALVTRAFEPLLEVCNRVTSCIIPWRIEYRDGLLGYTKDGTFVTSVTFNGAFQAVVFIGLAVALSQGSPERVVVFDELTRIIGSNKRRLVVLMLELIQDGTITQFLGNDGEGEPYRDLGEEVKIITVEP